MRVNPSAWQNAMKFRGFFASEFLKYHGPTDAEAGISIVEHAKKYSYSDRKNSIPGRTLRSWMSGESVPQWAVKTMVRYIIEKGYIPDSDGKLDALLVYLLVDTEFNSINCILSSHILNNLNKKEVENACTRIWHAKF
jgi:hypothetical protein